MANHPAFSALGRFSHVSLVQRLAHVWRPLASIARRVAFRSAVAITVVSGNPPTVNLNPAAGSTITPFQAITVNVADSLPCRQVLVAVSFPGMAAPELIWNGAFAPAYAAGSSYQAVPGSGCNDTLVLKRTGGWIGSPTIDVYAVDVNGNATAQ